MAPYDLPGGFSYGGMHCGIKQDGALDLGLIFSETPCTAAAVFTQNQFAAAPVVYDRRLLEFNPEGVQAVLINSGNANAVTGVQGMAAARRSAEALEFVFGLNPWSTLVMSTGVIGVSLPVDSIEAALPELYPQLRSDSDGFTNAARAIMTTDTRMKVATTEADVGGHRILLAGMSKGSGMIHPNMATMLAVITTDVAISTTALQLALKLSVSRSFNRISVDGDTSTNDTVAVLANGSAGNNIIDNPDSAAFTAFVKALSDVSTQLAKAIVQDGEGATKLVTIRVFGLENDVQAHQIANSIAISPLVKTAIYGGDANWGRILMAAGNSDIDFDTTQVELWFQGRDKQGENTEPLQVLANGAPIDYDESEARKRFNQPQLLIDIRLGDEPGQSTVWTCDLSHEYIRINSEYRT